MTQQAPDHALRRTLQAMLASDTYSGSPDERAWVEARLRAPVWPSRMRQRLLTLALRWSQDNDRQHEVALRQALGEDGVQVDYDTLTRPTTRAWKQLAAADPVPRQHDAVLHWALSQMVADADSGLSDLQRQWLMAPSRRTRPFTAQERARFKDVLMAWVEAKIPGCVAIVLAQFDTT